MSAIRRFLLERQYGSFVGRTMHEVAKQKEEQAQDPQEVVKLVAKENGVMWNRDVYYHEARDFVESFDMKTGYAYVVHHPELRTPNTPSYCRC